MPFRNRNTVTRTFKAAEIQRQAPASSGVYGLSNAREWIYVGEADDIRARLLEHLETSAFRVEGVPTGFSFELCPAGARLARQQELIAEFEPACTALLERRPAPPDYRSIHPAQGNS